MKKSTKTGTAGSQKALSQVFHAPSGPVSQMAWSQMIPAGVSEKTNMPLVPTMPYLPPIPLPQKLFRPKDQNDFGPELAPYGSISDSGGGFYMAFQRASFSFWAPGPWGPKTMFAVTRFAPRRPGPRPGPRSGLAGKPACWPGTRASLPASRLAGQLWHANRLPSFAINSPVGRW